MFKEKSARLKFHSKIKNQILYIFFFAGILPILVLGIFSIAYTYRQMDSHYRFQLSADAIRVNSVMFDITTTIYTSSETITNSESYMNLFGYETLDDSAMTTLTYLDNTLQAFRNNTAAVSSIHIYTDNPDIPDMNYISSMADFSNEEWYEKADNSWSLWTTLTRYNIIKKSYQELSLIRRIGVVSDKYSAYLVVSLDNNYLRNRLEQSDYKIAICMDDSSIFYASSPSLLQEDMIFPDDFTGEFYRHTGWMDIDGSKTLTNYVTFQPYKTDNLFFIQTCDTDAYQYIRHVITIYAVILIISIAAPTILMAWFSTYFSNRVRTLRSAMHQASIGDYNIIDQFKGDDELTETFDDLRSTVDLIHEKDARYYETELSKQQLVNQQQQMEFKMLASQINPHFLYNTLETIRMQALASNNQDVATSIKLLGKSMHYVLENTGTSFTALTNELAYIKTYLAIQKLRFGDRVNSEIVIDETLNTDKIKILPLLLQPIVENGIIHGLERVDGHGLIRIQISAEGDDLFITISDNGIGMDYETLQKLREKISTHKPEDTRSIGLYNITQRIHLYYGDDYYMTIDSNPEDGTIVTLKLPKETF